MTDRLLYGIQQVGIGVTDVFRAEKWYALILKASIKVIEDHNPATHMAPYMGGKSRNKSAIILLNPNGGGGFELWQHTEHTPQPPNTEIKAGDLGINFISLHSGNLDGFRNHLAQHLQDYQDISNSELYLIDPFGNQIHVKQTNDVAPKVLVTGVKECTIGVADLQASIQFYQQFGYSLTEQVDNVDLLEASLFSKDKSSGRFGSFFGNSAITLIQRKDKRGNKIYENRYWGDPGFIHLCFDVYNLKSWVNHLSNKSPFTILSNEDFKMGDAQGHWGYLEDPDATLIEMVEAHYIPIIKKLGLIINLKNKSPHKSVPKWLIWAMRLKKARV